jgi:DNA-directed RNA polymerase subunit RPC12/RpoP
MPDTITGLSCPNCSGALTVREGQRIVKCPYCSERSLVRGERGVRRYQVERRIERDRAVQSVRGFWTGLNRAFDLSRQAQITEVFLAYLPYWRAQGQMAGWIFGEKTVGSGRSQRQEPREVQVMEDVDWTGAAGDVAEFGVESIALAGTQFATYDPDILHHEGMVFEPTGSETDASEGAQQTWEKRAHDKSGLDHIGQAMLRFLRRTLALVYYPLWVARYTYRNRAYQVVVDGYSGRVLYGKAPGNIYYRALMLVGGTGLGAFVLVDGLALAFTLMSSSRRSSGSGGLVLLGLPVVVGAALIYGGYRLFRWGEEIELRVKGTE